VDLDEVLRRGVAIIGNRDAVIYNPAILTVSKRSRFKILSWMQYLHHSALLNKVLGLVSIAMLM
jgi:hypothetical protein